MNEVAVVVVFAAFRLAFLSFYDFNLPRFCFMVFLSDFSACICYSAFPLLDYYRSFPEFFMELNSEKKEIQPKKMM